VFISYLHLLTPTFDEPANHGSKIKMHRKVVAPFKPSLKLGLSCRRRPLRNQCTVCFGIVLRTNTFHSISSHEFPRTFLEGVPSWLKTTSPLLFRLVRRYGSFTNVMSLFRITNRVCIPEHFHNPRPTEQLNGILLCFVRV